MQILGKGNSAGSGATSLDVVLSATATAGNTVLLAVKGSSGHFVSSITDPRSNTWVDDFHTTSGSTVSIRRALMNTALQSGDTLTITPSSSGTIMDAVFYEYSGIASASPLDASSSGTGSSTTGSSGAVTVSVASDLLFSALSLNTPTGGYTVPSGYNDRGGDEYTSQSAVFAADDLPGATGDYNSTWSWTNSGNFTVAQLAYKAA